MDIFIFILIGLAIILLVAAAGRVGHNLGRINGKPDGWNEGESLRWLRESQEPERLEREGLTYPKSTQTGTVWGCVRSRFTAMNNEKN